MKQKQIKALILDIDGVIVGTKLGVNSPDPCIEVIDAMSTIVKNGIPIAFCTAKPYFAITKLIESVGGNNYHIADGGSVVINPSVPSEAIIFELDKSDCSTLIKILLENNVYIEIYTQGKYFIDKTQYNEQFTKGHMQILQQEAVLVDDLFEVIRKNPISKLMPVARDPEHKIEVQKLIEGAHVELSINWGLHPILLPLQFCIITAKGVSKKTGAEAFSKVMDIPLSNMLGVGDSTSDWNFIEYCGFGATLENANDEMKKLVMSKGEGRSVIGKAVNENGILDIFKYYGLL